MKKNWKILLTLLVMVLLTGCASKTKIYKQATDNVNLVLTTKSHDKYLFLGNKYQYLFTDTLETNKLHEIMKLAYNANSYEIGQNIKIEAFSDSTIKFHIVFDIEPRDEQLLSIVRLGFKQNINGDNNNNGKWRKYFELKGGMTLKDKSFVNKYTQNKLQNSYTTHITFRDDFQVKESISLPKPNPVLLTLFWLVVLL